jgi:hypothetical protein
MKGRGHAHESEEDMTTNFPNAIFNHFHDNVLNGIHVEGVTYMDNGGGHESIDLDTMHSTLVLKGNQPMVNRAKQQYLAFLLNLASGKLLTYSEVSKDGAVASQALQQISTFILDGNPDNDETAKDIGDCINNAQLVPAGVIDLSIPIIPYEDDVAVQPKPTVTMFSGVAPSPFRELSVLHFQLADASPVTLRIYNATGRLVRELLNEEHPAGFYSVAWNGRDGHGRRVAQGVYFARFQTRGYEATKRAVLLK